ncbi:CRISPR-associated endonuclease Cas2 [Oligella urethralis]|uniref:CRISPR-associated endonuclease Cas2 n=1 Tax=Oligella urethralis TaxID=90245 RepID=UPI000E02F53C|nr:CRISPR-associated endonuclease Cas2 [Oligella urethralis]SUA57397.1 CRISPR associated protein Cas2 [Oligella urethralis]
MHKHFSNHHPEHWLIAYDIHHDSLRNRIRTKLQALAISNQKSLYEILCTEKEMQELANFLSNDCMDPSRDKLLIACTTKMLKQHRLGNAKIINLKGLLVIS